MASWALITAPKGTIARSTLPDFLPDFHGHCAEPGSRTGQRADKRGGQEILRAGGFHLFACLTPFG